METKILEGIDPKEATSAIIDALEKYYINGIYTGDVSLLNEIFLEGTRLYGDVRNVPYAKTAEEYLSAVSNRVSPRDSGKVFKAHIDSIDVVNTIGVAKLRMKMYDFNYYDILSLHKIGNKWRIVNKLLTHVEE
jgi:hypothetical protein